MCHVTITPEISRKLASLTTREGDSFKSAPKTSRGMKGNLYRPKLNKKTSSYSMIIAELRSNNGDIERDAKSVVEAYNK